jgi:hypothetical protein
LTSSGDEIGLSYDHGFGTHVRFPPSDQQTVLTNGNSQTVNSVTFSTHYIQVIDCCVLVVFKMINSDSSNVLVDISCDNDFFVDGTSAPFITSLAT